MKELWTDLDKRRLRYDGVSIVEPSQLLDLFIQGVPPAKLRVSTIDETVMQFNQQSNQADQLKVQATEPISFSLKWQLPEDILNLDIQEHVFHIFETTDLSHYTPQQMEAAIHRVATELEEFERRGLFDVLKAIIFVIRVFKENNQIWGVGRGSSCASYILFLLDLHEVDPIIWDIDLEEFLHN